MSVRNALLGLLARHPSHGYELHAAFMALMGGQQNWELKPAQVYTTLSRLAEGGLVAGEGVEQDGGPEKQIYALTPSGRQAFSDWLNEPVEPNYQRDEFFLKLMLALASGVADPYQMIYIQRTHLYRRLHTATVQRGECDPRNALAFILLLDRTIMYLEADLRWLDMIEARLDEIRQQPLPEPVQRPRGRPPKEARK